jgi:hypothetical protein
VKQCRLPLSLSRATSDSGESRIVKEISPERMFGPANFLLILAKTRRPTQPWSRDQNLCCAAPGCAQAGIVNAAVELQTRYVSGR